MKFLSFKEEKNKVGRPKLADIDLKKKSVIMCVISFMLVVTLLVTGAFKLNIINFNKVKGASNINLCTAENINPEVLYDAETNPDGFSPEFLSIVMSSGRIVSSGPYPYNDVNKCSTITMDELKQIMYVGDYYGSSLTNTVGLQNLTNLTHLDLRRNQLTSIDLSNNAALTYLDLSDNKLTDIDLTNLINLDYFSIEENKVAGVLDLRNNKKLTNFDITNNRIEELYIDGNKELSGQLTLSSYGHNNNPYKKISIKNVPNLKDISFIGLYYLEELDLENTGISKILDNNGNYFNYLSSLKKINVSNTEVKELYLGSKKLETFIFDNVTTIEKLDLSNNKLAEPLDLSANQDITYLNLSKNQLTSIGDISNLTNLTSLNLYDNQLTSINLSNNTSLTSLDLSNNPLENIDISNTQLTSFSFVGTWNNDTQKSEGTLKTFKANNVLTLTWLNLDGNQLTSIDLSNNTALTYLSLSNNQLTNIDLSDLSNLDSLYLDGNQLTSIDLSQNTALTELYLNNNQLTSIGDISGLTNLTDLYLNNNRLTNIDVSKNANLQYLHVQNNNIENLKLYSKEESSLMHLIAYNNNIETLDLSNQPNLEFVMSNNNPITNMYIPKGNKVNYNEMFKIFEREDIVYNNNSNDIASYEDGIISALKVGKTSVLELQSENILSFKSESYDKAMYCDMNGYDSEECDIDWEKFEQEAILPYFMQLKVNVYDIESSVYSVDKKNKQIDAKGAKLDTSKIKLTLDGLTGYVEGNMFYIKDGDKIVDSYAIINQPNEKNGVVETAKKLSKTIKKVTLNKKEEDIEIKGTTIDFLTLNKVKGQDRNIVLTNGDLRLTINGLDLEKVTGSIDVSYTLEKLEDSTKKDELSKYVTDGYVLEFKNEKDLPGKALIEVKIGDKYKRLNIYGYKDKKLTMIAKNMKVEDGRVKFYASKLGTYVLTDKLKDNTDITYDDTMIKENSKSNKLFIIIPIILILAVISYIIYKKRK